MAWVRLSTRYAQLRVRDDIRGTVGVISQHQEESYGCCVLVCGDHVLVEDAVAIAGRRIGSIRDQVRGSDLRPG